MKKVMMILTQVLIFTGAYFVMTPDQLVDNTYIFGLIGNVEIIRGNSIWVMSSAAVLSVLNILIWWPKSPTRQSVEVAAAKSAETEEAKAKDQDPVVPKMD